MKQAKSIFAVLILALVLCNTALAAVAEGEPGTQAPPASAVFPAEVRESVEGDISRIEKVYYLTVRDDPSAIPTADFEREGRSYTLLDVLKNDCTETDTKEHIEVVTLDSDTSDMAKILQQLEPELEVTTEDGYTGLLAPDYPGIVVEAAGYETRARTVTTNRSYPNLSDADTSFVPKTIQDGGRTLTLADVQWQEVNGFYTANAAYTANAVDKYATGYTVTVEYRGEVSKTSGDTVIYTAIFTSHGETPITAGPAAESGSGHKLLLLIPLVLLLGSAGFGSWKLLTYLRAKKRGYVK